MKWDQSIEKLCARYCDESQVREQLHRKQFFHFSKLLRWFQLPIIILSATSASVQFLSKQFPKYESDIVTGTAFLSVFVSIISSVSVFLKLGENKSKNEVAEISWQAFYNSVSHQLSLKREHREDPDKFLQELKQNYERLFELSPMVGRSFVTDVRKAIEKHKSDEFCVPPYMNGYNATQVWEASSSFADNSVVSEVKLDV